MKKLRLIFINGAVSSITGILMNAIGVWMNVFITDRAGAEVMGRFQLIMSVCSFAVTFAMSGVSFAAMRLVAEGLGRSKKADIGKTMKKCFMYSAIFGVSACFLLFVLSETLAQRVLDYPNASGCLKIFAVSLPACSMLSAVSGYFTAVRRGFKDSGVRIFSQLLRLVFTVILLGLSSKDPCILIMLASVLSELAGAVLSFWLFLADRKVHRDGGDGKPGKILPIGIPIAFSTYLRSGIMTVKNLLVPTGLMKNGMTSAAAASAFGLVHGIVLPAVLFPASFLFSFTALTVPELARVYSGCKSIKDSRRISYMINRSNQLTLLFSVFASGFIFIFADEVAALVSKADETARYIRFLAPVIPVMYLDNTVDNMLKGLNEQVSSMKFNIIDSSVSLALVVFLLPEYGIYGYLSIIALTELMNFVMSIKRLSGIARFRIDVVSCILLPAFATVFSCVAVKMVFPHIHIAVKAAVAILSYWLMANLTGSFSAEDRLWLKKSL